MSPSSIGAPSAVPLLQRLGWIAAVFLMLIALLAPALWNGFPLLFADTGGYLARPFERTLLLGRSALYGTFLASGMRLDFWPVILIQTAATLWVILLTLRVNRLARPILACVVVMLLALLTSLPWYVSQLMPDVFAPVAILCLYLLAFAPDRLHTYETAGIAALIAISMAFHMAIIGLVVVLLAALFATKALRLLHPRLGLPLLVVLIGIGLAPLSNLAITGRFAFTPGGTHFVFARLLQDGIIGRYVKEQCPREDRRICAYADQLPPNADGWLWGWDGPFHRLGGWEGGYDNEARQIVLDTLRLYPADHLKSALAATLAQLVSFRTGEGVNANDLHHTLPMLEKLAPDTMPRVRAAAQQHDAFDFTWINRIHLPVGYLAFIILLTAVSGIIRSSPQPKALAATVLLTLVINAAICGALSNPNDRYQARIAPLALFAAALLLLQQRRTQENLAGAQGRAADPR
jgi:hypothetical protein